MSKCPICDTEYNSTDPCPDCSKKIHKNITITCVLECAPNGVSKQEGALLLDQLTKLFLSRGIAPVDIQFLEQYTWMDVQISKDEIEKLQKDGVFK